MWRTLFVLLFFSLAAKANHYAGSDKSSPGNLETPHETAEMINNGVLTVSVARKFREAKLTKDTVAFAEELVAQLTEEEKAKLKKLAGDQKTRWKAYGEVAENLSTILKANGDPDFRKSQIKSQQEIVDVFSVEFFTASQEAFLIYLKALHRLGFKEEEVAIDSMEWSKSALKMERKGFTLYAVKDGRRFEIDIDPEGVYFGERLGPVVAGKVIKIDPKKNSFGARTDSFKVSEALPDKKYWPSEKVHVDKVYFAMSGQWNPENQTLQLVPRSAYIPKGSNDIESSAEEETRLTFTITDGGRYLLGKVFDEWRMPISESGFKQAESLGKVRIP